MPFDSQIPVDPTAHSLYPGDTASVIQASSSLHSPDIVHTIEISDTQDLSRLRGVDDSILKDLPSNPPPFSISDSEMDMHNGQDLSAVDNTDNDICDHIANMMQAYIIDERQKRAFFSAE